MIAEENTMHYLSCGDCLKNLIKILIKKHPKWKEYCSVPIDIGTSTVFFKFHQLQRHVIFLFVLKFF